MLCLSLRKREPSPSNSPIHPRRPTPVEFRCDSPERRNVSAYFREFLLILSW